MYLSTIKHVLSGHLAISGGYFSPQGFRISIDQEKKLTKIGEKIRETVRFMECSIYKLKYQVSRLCCFLLRCPVTKLCCIMFSSPTGGTYSSKVGVGGDSAGGTIVASVTHSHPEAIDFQVIIVFFSHPTKKYK